MAKAAAVKAVAMKAVAMEAAAAHCQRRVQLRCPAAAQNILCGLRLSDDPSGDCRLRSSNRRAQRGLRNRPRLQWLRRECLRALVFGENLQLTDDQSGALTRVEISGQWLLWRLVNFGRRDVFHWL